MARRVFAVILLVLGGCFLGTAGAVLGFVFEHVAMLIAIGIYLVLGVPLTLGGMALWGWRRWRIVLGVEFTVIGGMLVLAALSMGLTMMSPEWKTLNGPDVEQMAPMLVSAPVCGALCLLLGIPLILSQRTRDKAASVRAPSAHRESTQA